MVKRRDSASSQLVEVGVYATDVANDASRGAVHPNQVKRK